MSGNLTRSSLKSPQAYAIAAALFGGVALLSSLIEIPFASWFNPDSVRTAPSSAAALILTALAAFIQSSWPARRGLMTMARLLVAASLILLLLSLLFPLSRANTFALQSPAVHQFEHFLAGSESIAAVLMLFMISVGVLLVPKTLSDGKTNPSPAGGDITASSDLSTSIASVILLLSVTVAFGALLKVFLKSAPWSFYLTLPVVLGLFCICLFVLTMSTTRIKVKSFHFPIFIAFGAGTLISMIVFIFVQHFENSQTIYTFEQKSTVLSTALNRSMTENLSQLQSLSSFFKASRSVTRHEFRLFATDLLKWHSGIQAFSWSPVVHDLNRADFLAQAEQDGVDSFRITEQDASGNIIPAATRSEYVVVYYVEPFNSNQNVVGYDSYSDSIRKAVIDKAWKSGMAAASGPLDLVQDDSNSPGILVFQPVYFADSSTFTEQESDGQITGFVVGALKIDEIISASLVGIDPSGLMVYVSDVTNPEQPTRLYSNTNTAKPNNHYLNHFRQFQVADRTWRFESYSTEPFSPEQWAWQAWTAMATGLLLTILLGTYLITSANRTEEIRAAQRALSQSETRYRALIESANDAIITFNRDNRITTWNSGARIMFGYQAGEIMGRSIEDLISSDRLEPLRSAVRWVHSHIGVSGKTFEQYGLKKGDEEFPMEISLAAWEANGKRFVTGIMRDITERKEIEKKLLYLSTHDPLTGLYNRAYFEAELTRLEKSRLYPLTIIIADVDDLKYINDNFGHEAGDQVLKCAAKILRSPFRNEDMIARIGGDEFVILLTEVTQITAEMAIDRIHLNQEDHNRLEGHHYISISLGTATAAVGESIMAAHNRADIQMYQDKAQNKKRSRPAD